MIVGLPREIKDNENRVGMVPAGVKALTSAGHTVYVEHDAGAGSGRFLLAAARRFPNAKLVAVETDPLALAILRANLAVRGLARRAGPVP